MATVEQTRDAIAVKLGGVPGAGIVHRFERYATKQSDFRTLFEIDGQVRGWTVRRVATREESPAVGRWRVTHRWQIRVYMSLDDAAESEVAFDNLVEAARDAFRADETLGGLIDDTVSGPVSGLQLDDSGPVMFAGVLCHAARLTLHTRHTQ